MSPEALLQHATALESRLNEVTAERDRLREMYLQMLEKCRTLEKGLFGQKRERLIDEDGQLTLDVLEELLGGLPEPEEPEKPSDDKSDSEPAPSKPSRAGGRRRPPEHLPRIDIEVLPPEVELDGLLAFDRIGEDVTEVIEHRRASIVVVRVVRPKFVRKSVRAEVALTDTPQPADAQPTVLQEAPLDLPIPRGSAGPGLLSDTIVRRWQDHLPLHRLESIYARDGLDLARSTMCSWHMQLAELVEPLIKAMWADARGQPYLCTDATGVLVQAKEKCRRSHFWVVIAPERHVLFNYSKKHDSAAVDAMLKDYRGFLAADAHSVYDHLYKDGKVTEVGCWAHLRRYFFKSLDSEPERARKALSLVNALFRLERDFKKETAKRRHKLRQRKAKPIIKRFFEWCMAGRQHHGGLGPRQGDQLLPQPPEGLRGVPRGRPAPAAQQSQ